MIGRFLGAGAALALWAQGALVGAAVPGPFAVLDRAGKDVGLFRESHALVIGVSDYTPGWPDLPGVARDTEAVANALEAQGFAVDMVRNPTAERLQRAYREFIGRHGLEPEKRLVFWFAGHGHTERKSYGGDVGYIVPADAPLPDRDRAAFLDKALSMEQMEVYARSIDARHELFLFDSCFSGQLFTVSRAVPDHITYKTALPVRQFITSGSAGEQVPDRSIFREQFEEALRGEADRNEDGYVTGAELGEFLQEKVLHYSRGSQHPQYGKIRDTALDKGDFVFGVTQRGAEGTERWSDPFRWAWNGNSLRLTKDGEERAYRIRRLTRENLDLFGIGPGNFGEGTALRRVLPGSR